VKALCRILFALLLVRPSHGEKDIQSQVISLSATASDAALPITINFAMEGPPETSRRGSVIGTGFLINTSGDFITAGHVIDSLKQLLKEHPEISDSFLAARIRNRAGGGSEVQFTITDRDDDHDLVLCHLAVIKPVTPEKSQTPKSYGPESTDPFASLAISRAQPQTGQFVLVSGFPLYSWTPTVQFGMVAATASHYPTDIRPSTIRKDSGTLLQISVNANHGNSGGPVIDLESGQVIGVLDAFVPAPLQVGQQLYGPSMFSASGIMFAVPAKWVEALLEKNHIKSEGVRAGKLVAF
jgi:S1-C subfamily serine protease